MGKVRMGSVYKLLCQVLDRAGESPLTDAQLLERFAASRDEAAFEVLVYRHSKTVWNACRRVLSREHDVEDAFQATFLTLTCKAGSVAWQSSVAGWLRKVARRVALQAKAKASSQANLEQRQAVAEAVEDPTPACVWREVRSVLDEEIERLPRKYRLPFVLCQLEGKTNAEASRELGCPENTIASRLARARERLAKRLSGRGVTLPAGLGAAVVLDKAAATAAVSSQLISSTVRAGLAYASSGVRAGIVSAEAVTLAEGVILTMQMTKIGVGVGIAVFVGLLAGGTGYVVSQKSAPPTGVPNATVTVAEKEKAGARQAARVDCYGDPLPEGALARVGTVRFRIPESRSIVFGSDGQTLISFSNFCNFSNIFAGYGGVIFWDLTTGKERRRCKFESLWEGCVSSDGKWLVGLDSKRKEVQSWNLDFDPPRLRWKQEFDEANDIVLSRDGKTLVCRGRGSLFLLDTETGKTLHTVVDDGNNMKLAPDGKTLAIWSLAFEPISKTVCLWDTTTGVKRQTLTFPQPFGSLECAFTPDCRMLATATPSEDWKKTVIRLWDTATGREQYQWSIHKSPNISGIALFPFSIAFLPDGKTLVGSEDGQLRFWDPATGKEQRPAIDCPGLGRLVSPSPDGKYLVSSADDESAIRVWETKTGKLMGSSTEAPFSSIDQVAFSLDGKFVATVVRDKIQLWDAATGQQKRSFDQPRRLDQPRSLSCSWANHLSYFGNHHLYSFFRPISIKSGDAWVGLSFGRGNEDRKNDHHVAMMIWDTRTGTLIDSPPPLPADLTSRMLMSEAISADGRLVVLGRSDGVTLYERSTGKVLHTLKDASESSYLAFAADGQSLLSYKEVSYERRPTEKFLSIWNVETGRLRMREQRIHVAHLGGGLVGGGPYALSSDGRRLAVAVNDDGEGGQTIRVWEVASSKIGWQLTGHKRNVKALAFSQDGRTLSSGDEDGVIRLWDLASGQEIRCLTGHQSQIETLAFAPDSLRLASGSHDSTALIWDVQNIPRPAPAASRPEPAVLWKTLTEPDPARAYCAIGELAETPEPTLALLRNNLQEAAQGPDLQQVAHWLKDLERDRFEVRTLAFTELEKRVEWIEPALRQALADKPSLEQRRRLEALIGLLDFSAHSLSPGFLAVVRGVEVVERIGAPAARHLLEEWARSTTSGGLLAREAKAALQRITTK